ncbi:hypothetical protein [Burkholderia multivorans]|uniref:hypothetical protein n=1 Tax=Burkholderia multivorans TaxID=87883 RepID=UPI00075BFE90|nr:hypothetical protein [Burkholderia multivorans]KVS15354.1 hypothetical protein WK33_07605 [Burkholderia multivorans]MBU9258713.1 hypothetical protein [Burkholderia multivorans]MDN7761003.1 hypothetical protein [Burkholderia multivorans]MDN8104251.1 hypothetical protein [Burkholderia multivorans]
MTSMEKNFEAAASVKEAFISEVSEFLANRNDEELGKFFHLTMQFVTDYATGYELDGELCLVLDNSLIQDFKHRENNAKRALHAHAHTAFCRFVSGWSDRPTRLAISAVAVYEHLGRRAAVTSRGAWAAMSELLGILSITQLPVHAIGFSTPEDLASTLNLIDSDARFLAKLVQEIDTADWKLTLRQGTRVKIPLAIAFKAIPDDLPLQYFSPWYVKFTFASRIEQLIRQQSGSEPDAPVFASGNLSEALAQMNELKRGILKGLGDIDLLQICDVSRQYKQRFDTVMLGQTMDKTLAKVLFERHTFHESRQWQSGSPDADEQQNEFVKLFCSNPFAEYEARGRRIRERALDFIDVLTQACVEAQHARRPQPSPAQKPA